MKNNKLQALIKLSVTVRLGQDNFYKRIIMVIQKVVPLLPSLLVTNLLGATFLINILY